MRIGVNTRFLLPQKLEGLGWYTYEILQRIVKLMPEHDFVFFFDRPYDEKFIFSSNITPVVINPPARHPILWYLWCGHCKCDKYGFMEYYWHLVHKKEIWLLHSLCSIS